MPNEFKGDEWKIRNDPPPKDGDKLNDLHIEKTSTGYDLMFSSSVLASTTKTAPPFEFKNVSHDGETWNILVNKPLPAGKNGKGTWHMHGKHHKPPMPPTGPADGDFTAQSGTGLGEEPGKAAESGKAASLAKGN
jgi:hypothetical protein